MSIGRGISAAMILSGGGSGGKGERVGETDGEVWRLQYGGGGISGGFTHCGGERRSVKLNCKDVDWRMILRERGCSRVCVCVCVAYRKDKE